MFLHFSITRRRIAALALVGACAGVQAQAVTSTTVPNSYPMTAVEFDALRGQFVLPTGSNLQVSRHNRKFYLDMEGQPTIEIRPTAAGAFVAPTSGTALLFKQASNGNAYGVTLTKVAKN